MMVYENSGHLFGDCSLSSLYWSFILDAFKWSIAPPYNVFDLLSLISMGYLFHGAKKDLWLASNKVFFWKLWCELNSSIFKDIASTFENFMHLVLFNYLYW